MVFKDGELLVQELGSSKHKHRDDEDLARHGKKQQFQVCYHQHSRSWIQLNKRRGILGSCQC
jgi:hypothetical protein